MILNLGRLTLPREMNRRDESLRWALQDSLLSCILGVLEVAPSLLSGNIYLGIPADMWKIPSAWGFPLEARPKQQRLPSQNALFSLAFSSDHPRLEHLAAEHQEGGE